VTAWPWPPIQIGVDEWVVMRNSPSLPKAVVRFFEATERSPAFYRAATWAPRSEERELIGYYPTLELADSAILEDSPGRIAVVPDRR